MKITGKISFHNDLGYIYFEGLSEYVMYWAAKELGLQMNEPLIKAHLSFFYPKFDKFDANKLKQFKKENKGRLIDLEVDLRRTRINKSRKGFYIALLNIEDDKLTQLRKDLGIVKFKKKSGFHITLATTKDVGEYEKKMKWKTITEKGEKNLDFWMCDVTLEENQKQFITRDKLYNKKDYKRGM